MIQEMGQSTDNVLGYRVVGDVTKDDYGTLVPQVEAAVKQYGAIRILFNMSDFKWERVDAWGSDFGFGKEFKNSIERMALVGHESWGKHMARIAQPFYAQEVQWFEDEDKAWTWVKS
ncbi:MAG: STAS/SEC14 domain-containing protein [Acidimicrobiia bacterium]